MDESRKPTQKVAAASAGGAAATLIVFALTQLGVELGPTEAGAIATLCAVAAGYVRREF
jgi:hypothetical protein